MRQPHPARPLGAHVLHELRPIPGRHPRRDFELQNHALRDLHVQPPDQDLGRALLDEAVNLEYIFRYLNQ